MCTLHATEPAEWVVPGPRFLLALRTYSPLAGAKASKSWPLAFVTKEPKDVDLGIGTCSSRLPKSFDSRGASPRSIAKAEGASRPRSMAKAEALDDNVSVEAATRKEPPRPEDVPGRAAPAAARDEGRAPF